MSLIAELKRRNVFRVAAAYLVVGWLLTEVLTTILPTLGVAEWVSRAVILIFAFGFIPAVVLSWIYEVTPDGIKREHEVDREESITTHTAKRLDYVTVGAVIVGIVFFATFSARQTPLEGESTIAPVHAASVAVLPFVNMSNDEENEYFSDGLTETLLHMLSQIPDLKVAARTSSFSFKNQGKTIQEVARALQVAHVLEGSVQRVGDRVRITAQLIRAQDGFHVWSENYDRTLDDIFRIQDEIAAKVGKSLSVSLLGTPAEPHVAGVTTDSHDAYDLYLQALKEKETYSYGGLQAAERLLKGALTIDPEFLDAKTELANNYLQQIETGLVQGADVLPQILATVDQVLAVKPDNLMARAIKVFAEAATATLSGNTGAAFAAIAELESLVEEDPGELQPRIFLTRLFQATQQIDRALPLMLEARDRDPFNPRIHYELGSIYSAMQEFDLARAALDKSLKIEPAQPNAYANLGALSLQEGDGLHYLQKFIKAIEVDSVDYELPGIIANFLYQLELVDEADDFRRRVLAIAPTSPIAYRLELLRAIALEDEVASVASARRAIEDDIEDRRFSYGGAVQHLLRVAAARGTVAEEMAYIESRAPRIFDIDAEIVPLKHRSAQLAAFDAWYTTLPGDELERRIDHLWGVAESLGIDPSANPYIEFGTLALRGESERAADVALERIFSKSVAVHLGWEDTLRQAQYSEVVEDPRVQAAMQKWQREEDQLREQIRTWLADLHAAT